MHSHDYYVVTVDLADTKAQKKWDAYVDKHPIEGHHHYSCYITAIKDAYQHETSCIAVLNKSDNSIAGLLPLVGMKSRVFGSHFTSIPFFNYGGPLYDNKNVLQILLYEAETKRRTLGYRHLQLRCLNDDISSLDSVLNAQTHKACMILDLPDDVKKIGAGNAKKRAKLRSQAKLAERRADEDGHEVKQVFGGGELIDDFYTVFSQHMHALGTPVYGKAFFNAIFTNIPSTITVVYWDGEPVASGWLFEHASQVSIPWASALKKVNRLSINTYMYYNILSRCIDEGRQRFDFGRSTIDANTYKFKLQWGAEHTQCYWYENKPLDENDNNESFSLAVKCWKKLPLFVANKLGPILIKNIP